MQLSSISGKGTFIIPEDDLLKGYVRPFRRTYIHRTCSGHTRAPHEVGEMFALSPQHRTHTFCAHCQETFPLAEFNWKDGATVGS